VRIDLNADLGEGFGAWTLGDDDALLGVVTSANVACGFHAGDPAIMQRVCATAAARGVAIGAQVAYRDLVGFGRRRMDIAADELGADVLYQLGALDAFARVAGTRVRYVKPHGALYNTAADDAVQALAVADAVARYDRSLPLLGLPSSALETAAAEAGIPFVAEAFADRAYTPEGRLVPRSIPGAVHDDEARVVARAVAFARDERVASICLHGDTPGAVSLARAVRAALEERGVSLAPFVS
jgi:5-oxoprolinase (ATP-hydrolysing) subunit A